MALDKKQTPEYLGRKGKGTMKKSEFNSVVNASIAECVTFVDGELSIDRALASDYYGGKLFGNEEEGRSKVVLTKVRDTVDGMTPSLVRVAFGAEHAVEFVPTRADNVEQAEQKTDYVRYVFEQDNSGVLRSLAVLKDGLVRKIGIFKWGWDESVDTKAYKQEGIDQQQLEGLAADDEIELTTASPRGDGTFNVEFTRTSDKGRARIWEIPPEEFGYNRQARSLSEALVVFHRMEKTRGQLVAMGIKEKELDEHAGGDDTSLKSNPEEVARREMGAVGRNPSRTGFGIDPEMGKANKKILYCEAYMNVDFDGDGIAELRRVCTIGNGYYPISNDPADERPFAIFTPYPEPHALLGGSVADRTMDMQKIGSSILRAILDGAAASAFPRIVYLESGASGADIMNNAIGAPIRERVLNAVRTLETPFVGKELLPLLQFVDDTIEGRTGKRKGAAGLDSDSLQSTTKEGVDAAISGDQEQMQLIARVFAEMTLKPLFEGLGRMVQKYQPRARLVRLRGKWVDIDPKTWDSSMDVTVNVMLGASSTEEKVAILTGVAADQENLIQQLGLANPATSLPKFLNTRRKILELRGIKDFESYYNPLPPDWQPPPPPPVPPDPSVLAMQAESEMSHVKAMKELAIKADELALKKQELELKASEHEMAMSQLALDQKNAEFEQAFKLEQLAVTTATARLQIQATIDAQAADRELAASQDGSANELKFRLKELELQNTPEPPKPQPPPPAPIINVAPAAAPNVHIAPAEVTVNHTPPPPEAKKSKRKGKIKKEPDGSFSFESDN